ncbi:MAG: insulinase family protein [Bacteroidales bacterium]|nr:insulinase family protein [Bacteroidales bacterium]MBK7627419.1 insulinase family protein [Bacteroidales bacterium]
MINYNRFTLDNGLKVLVHEDRSTPLVAMNILYNVGSRDEDPGLTGLAHLFEHLMFGGSVNVPDYDLPLQMVGGDNNAFTNSDITNYYLTIPSDNIETGFWLESDRMLELDFSQKNLDTQRSVVIEEFNQRYLNQPYGDAILKIRPLAYKVHPYRWPTIGMDISHIEKVSLDQIKKFFFSHYAPNNAVLSITGNINLKKAEELTRKWFGPIEKRRLQKRNIPQEPEQRESRTLTIEKDVPSNAIYKVWHVGPRMSEDFYTLDLITDLLAGGETGRLHTRLVREKKLFSEINAYITSDIDPGLIIMQGKLMKDVDIQHAEESVNEVIESLKNENGLKDEIEKVKNKFESSTVFSNTNILNKAINLSFYELLGDPDQINREVADFRKVTLEMVTATARKYFTPGNCSTLYYISTRRD